MSLQQVINRGLVDETSSGFGSGIAFRNAAILSRTLPTSDNSSPPKAPLSAAASMILRALATSTICNVGASTFLLLIAASPKS